MLYFFAARAMTPGTSCATQSASHSGGTYFGVDGTTGAAGAAGVAGAAGAPGSTGSAGAGSAGAAGSDDEVPLPDSLPAPLDPFAGAFSFAGIDVFVPGTTISAPRVSFDGARTFVSAPPGPSTSASAPPPQATANVRATAALRRTNFIR